MNSAISTLALLPEAFHFGALFGGADSGVEHPEPWLSMAWLLGKPEVNQQIANNIVNNGY